MTDVEYIDPFYSLGRRLKSEQPKKQTISQLHNDAKNKARDAGVPLPFNSRKFRTKNSHSANNNNTVKSAKQGWRPNSYVGNPYKAQTQNNKLSILVAERARNI